ncbi:MAG: hypothetical protein ACJAYB_000106 [Psychromonas sp.]|jgi:hypothetical protein
MENRLTNLSQTNDSTIAQLFKYSETNDSTVIQLFKNSECSNVFLAAGQSILDAFEPDVSTAKGRKAIISLASSFSKSKVYLDEIGKELNANLKKTTSAVDKDRKSLRDGFDQLRDAARKPVTDWESEQKEIGRQKEIEAARVALKEKRNADHDSAIVADELFDLKKEKQAQADLAAEKQRQESIETAARQRAEFDAMALISKAKADQEKAEEATRKATEKADQAEKDKAFAIESARIKEIEHKRVAEQNRIQTEKDNNSAIEAAKVKAIEDKRVAEQNRIQAERDAKAAQKLALKKQQQEFQDKQVADKLKLEQEEADRLANQQHVTAIKTQVKQMLMSHGILEPDAVAAVIAITKHQSDGGKLVSIKF